MKEYVRLQALKAPTLYANLLHCAQYEDGMIRVAFGEQMAPDEEIIYRQAVILSPDGARILVDMVTELLKPAEGPMQEVPEGPTH